MTPAIVSTGGRSATCGMTLHHFTDLDDHLAVGSYPHAPEHVLMLREHGVRAVVCLQSDEDLARRGLHWPVMWQLYVSQKVRVKRVPIQDFEPRDLERHLDDAVSAIASAVDAGRKTYVHCNAGLNRSPSAVIAYVASARGLSIAAATRWLADRHECAPYPDVLARWAGRHDIAVSDQSS